MNAPDNDPFAYDDRLRAHYEEAAHQPLPPLSAGSWEQVRARLHPTPAPARRAPWAAGAGGLLLGVLLGVLLGWGGWRTTTERGKAAAVTPGLVAGTGERPAMTPAVAVAPGRVAAATTEGPGETPVRRAGHQPVARATAFQQPAPAGGEPAGRNADEAGTPGPVGSLPTGAVTLPGAGGVSGAIAPAPGSPMVPVVLLPLLETETTLAAVPTDSARPLRERRRAALLAQRTALAVLRHRTDSLLLALGEPLEPVTPAALPGADSVAPAPLRHRWSVALAFAPERNFFGLGAPAADTLAALRRTHEQGRGGYNAALMAEYRLTDRLSVGAGVGVASYGAELRLTDHRTTVTTKLDSTQTTTTQINSVVTQAFIVRLVADSILAPIVNFDNQIIGYHYLPTTRRDTVRTNLTNKEVRTHTTTTYTPTITTRQEVSARILKPNYRFVTVPVLLRYRLGRATDWTPGRRAPRWWADVALGAQVQLFLGGTQLTTLDGLTYQTARVGARGGPFRPWNLALTGAVAFNYALTPRLSASLAPTLRYQVESVYKASTNLTQRPMATGVQVGLRLAF